MKCHRSVKKMMEGMVDSKSNWLAKATSIGTDVRDALAALGDPILAIEEVEPDLEVAAEATDSSFDVTMVLFNGNDELSLSYLNGRAGQEPRPALFALLHDRSPDLMKRVLRAGADELLFLPLDPGDATRALLKISETRRREEVHVGGGQIVSLVSLIGGTGVTSLAANLALALRYAFDKRVAVVDLDLQTGGMSVFLNLEPERTIMALVEGTRKLDSIQLESALSKHASGVYLLAAPKRIEDSELVSDVTVGATLELMRQLFDFVIVDCGTHIDENIGRGLGAFELSVLCARPVDWRRAMRVAIRRPGGTAGTDRSRAELYPEPLHARSSDH